MYKVRISRLAMRDISRLAPQYTRLVSLHIDDLSENPDLVAPRGFEEKSITVFVQGCTGFSTRLMTMNEL